MTARRLLSLLLAAAAAAPCAAAAAGRVADLTVHAGDVPRRLVGYGLVVGLDGTGDRSYGGYRSHTATVRSVVNLLRRFEVQVPAEHMRLRDVAAVLVTAELSPYLRAGGRFDVQVSALADATSLRGGVLWMTPLLADPDQLPVATAQGPIALAADEGTRAFYARRANSGRIPQGGVLEADPPAVTTAARLLLREPDLRTATRIAQAVDAAFGAGTARVEDPGSVTLRAPQAQAGDLPGFLAAVDTVAVATQEPARIVINVRDGTVVAGGGVQVGPAVVSHHGFTLSIGGVPARGGAAAEAPGLVRLEPEASVQDVAAGLHAAGARPEEVAAIFEALQAAGALRGQLVVR